MKILTILSVVRVVSMIKCLALAAVVLAIGTGCSGIATTQSFSPLMFFLPGLVQTKPVPPQIVPVMQQTSPAQVIASNRDLTKAN